MFFPLTIVESIATWILLAVAIAILYMLIRIQKITKKKRQQAYPFVILYREGGDAIPLGTYALREHVMMAFREAVKRNTGVGSNEQIPDSVLAAFSPDGMSWRGKNRDGKKIHLWVEEVRKIENN